jgi:hypothetical protein
MIPYVGPALRSGLQLGGRAAAQAIRDAPTPDALAAITRLQGGLGAGPLPLSPITGTIKAVQARAPVATAAMARQIPDWLFQPSSP